MPTTRNMDQYPSGQPTIKSSRPGSIDPQPWPSNPKTGRSTSLPHWDENRVRLQAVDFKPNLHPRGVDRSGLTATHGPTDTFVSTGSASAMQVHADSTTPPMAPQRFSLSPGQNRLTPVMSASPITRSRSPGPRLIGTTPGRQVQMDLGQRMAHEANEEELHVNDEQPVEEHREDSGSHRGPMQDQEDEPNIMMVHHTSTPARRVPQSQQQYEPSVGHNLGEGLLPMRTMNLQDQHCQRAQELLHGYAMTQVNPMLQTQASMAINDDTAMPAPITQHHTQHDLTRVMSPTPGAKGGGQASYGEYMLQHWDFQDCPHDQGCDICQGVLDCGVVCYSCERVAHVECMPLMAVGHHWWSCQQCYSKDVQLYDGMLQQSKVEEWSKWCRHLQYALLTRMVDTYGRARMMSTLVAGAVITLRSLVDGLRDGAASVLQLVYPTPQADAEALGPRRESMGSVNEQSSSAMYTASSGSPLDRAGIKRSTMSPVAGSQDGQTPLQLREEYE